ncbi:MAG: ASCH domain-containing protein [Pseudomonadota bacterium]
MQSLGVVPRLWPAIVSGEKSATIRWHEARIVPGPMRYRCDGMPERSAVVEVLRVTDLPLSEVAAHLGRQADWPDAVLLDGMREHYPDIALDDVVQVIEHTGANTTH